MGSPGNSTPTDSRSNQLTGGTFDASGNLHSWNGASYDYDELNQLKHYKNGAQEWFYMYDADGERVWQLQPPINGLARFDRWTLRGLDAKVRRTFELYGYAWGNAWGGSNLWEDYIYRGGPLLASYYSDGYQRHVDVDHLGTPRLITTPGSGQTGGFYTLTPCRILDTRQTGAPLTQTNPQRVYQVSGACGVPASAQAVALNVTLVNATTNLSVQGYPGDLPAPGAPGTNVVSASPPDHATIAGAAVLPLATNGSGTLGVLMTLAPPATSGQTDLLLDVSGYFAPAAAAPVVGYHAYLPFGVEATYFAQDFERMKFTGHERDLADPSSPADDLDYMHARHYNFLTGRFLSVDVIGGSASRPQSLNRYSYARLSPLTYVDLNGLDPQAFLLTVSDPRWGGHGPWWSDFATHSAIYISDDNPARPLNIIFENGGRLKTGADTLAAFLAAYPKDETIRAYRLRLAPDQVNGMVARLQGTFQTIKVAGLTVSLRPDYDVFNNNCAQFACAVISGALSDSGLFETSYMHYAETITVKAYQPIFLSSDLVAFLYGLRFIDRPFLVPPGAQVIYYLSYHPPQY